MLATRHTCLRLAFLLLAVSVATAGWLSGQAPADPRPTAAYTLISPEGRQTIPAVVLDGHDLVALEDLARLLGLTVREDRLSGGLVVTRKSKSAVLARSQGLASTGGRVVALPMAPVRSPRGWLVPVDFVGRALSQIYEERLELRRASRLIVAGAVTVPAVVLRTSPQGTGARLTIDITPPTGHTLEQRGQRLVLTLQADAVDANLSASGVPDVVSGPRVLDPAGVVVELGPRFQSLRWSEAPLEPAGTRIVVDITGPPPAPPAPAAPALPVPAAPPTGPVAAPPPTSAIRTVVVDPGHGGEEDGAIGPRGTMEKDITLVMARQLKAALEARLGVRVVLTREGDETVPLDERAAIANNHHADVFISLHANASVRSAATGAEVFYLSLDPADGNRTAAEPPGDLLPVVGGGERQVQMILWEMAQVAHLERSAALAELLEQQLRVRLAMSPRAIQQAPFRVLVGANMPAVLVETGFITNPAEETRLKSPAHQAAIVQAIVDGVVRFRDLLEGRGAGPATGPGEVRR